MELFNENGHLTDEGLRAVIDGALDERQSLEAAEHFSFCNKCLVKYTRLLDEEPLLTPETPLREPVLRRLRKRATRIFFNKYATVAAAACLAAGLWFASSYLQPAAEAAPPVTPPAQSQAQAELEPTATSFGSKIDQALGTANSALDNIFSPFKGKGAGTPPASQTPESTAQKADEPTDVFKKPPMPEPIRPDDTDNSSPNSSGTSDENT